MTEQELVQIERHFEYSEGEAWAAGPALVAEVRRLRGLVQAAEWSAGGTEVKSCPWCWTTWPEAHRDDCPAFPPEP